MKSLMNVVVLVSSLACVGLMACKSPSEDSSDKTRSGLRGERREAPAEAFDACNDKKEGDSCALKRGDRDMEGKCASAPKGATDQRLMCRPEQPGAPRPGRDRPRPE